MSALRFEWDPRKAAANLRKHGVSFSEAEEDRFVLLGVSATSRLLVVVHCYRAAGLVIRIISARKADRIERRQYEEGGKP